MAIIKLDQEEQEMLKVLYDKFLKHSDQTVDFRWSNEYYLPENEKPSKARTNMVLENLARKGYIDLGKKEFYNTRVEIQKKLIDHFEKKEPTVVVSAIEINDIDYVGLARIQTLEVMGSGEFDLSKAIRLLEEINSSYKMGNYYATALLLRAFVDHIPPIFKQQTFDQVAANFIGGKSIKKRFENLNNNMRQVADIFNHYTISKKETLPTKQTVDFKSDFDFLLEQIIKSLN
jgi:hypothetical protein